MNPAADNGRMGVVIPLPVPLRDPDWAAIDRLAGELALWDPRDPWSVSDELYPPPGWSMPAPRPVLRLVR